MLRYASALFFCVEEARHIVGADLGPPSFLQALIESLRSV